MLPHHAHCVLSGLCCNSHSLPFGFLSRIERIENPSCSTWKHSSQDTSHLILHCQLWTVCAAYSLATLCLSMTSGPGHGEFPSFWGTMVFRHAPIPQKGWGNQQHKFFVEQFPFKLYSKYKESSVYDGPDLRCFEVMNVPHKMENAAEHPTQLEDFYPKVKVVYLPPNTVALLQPMDLGVIASFKAYYLRRTIAMALHATTLYTSCLYCYRVSIVYLSCLYYSSFSTILLIFTLIHLVWNCFLFF